MLKKKEDSNRNKTPAISIISEMENNSSGNFSLGHQETLLEEREVESLDFTSTEDLEIDWDFPQELRTDSNMLMKHPYGFNNRFTEYFDDIMEVSVSCLELLNEYMLIAGFLNERNLER